MNQTMTIPSQPELYYVLDTAAGENAQPGDLLTAGEVAEDMSLRGQPKWLRRVVTEIERKKGTRTNGR
jgi:hypothetical protein